MVSSWKPSLLNRLLRGQVAQILSNFPIHLRKNGAHNTNQKKTKQAIKQKTLGHTKNL